MNPLTLEWVEKAEGDFITATRELRARNAPNFDAVCFHAQQMAEKYFKAVLQEYANPIPKTHNLADLMALCMKIDPTYQIVQSELNILEGYAVQFRYPGPAADKLEAKTALKAAKSVRTFFRTRLGLP
ncbi:MAG: HEPN domain-containing protein [Chloroflexi bacterium]|nr:HEPN domain-containing protein [Chloroflexota bacterium]